MTPSSLSPRKKRARSPVKEVFLNKDSNLKVTAFDPDERLRDISSIWETKFEEFSSQMKKSMSEQKSLDEVVALLKAKSKLVMVCWVIVLLCQGLTLSCAAVNELEGMRDELTQLNTRLRNDLDDTKAQLATSNVTLDDLRRSHSFEVDDLRRQYRNDLEDLKQDHRRKLDEERKISDHSAEKIAKDFEEQIESLLKVHKEELSQAEKQLKTELEEERSRRNREIQELSTQLTLKLQNAGLDLDTKHREAESVRAERDQALAALDREKALRLGVEHKLADAASSNIALETANRAMKAKIDFLESDNQAQSSAFVDLHKRMQEAIDEAALTNEKLRAEETLRRKLHNQVQELRGNIRVMCRVRPAMDGVESDPAKIDFPDEGVDSKELMVTGPEKVSAMGNVTATNNAFSFDRVFTPVSQNAEVFEEISQLVQSALDGYNVCIFCYGQTGSGKTFTMSSADGMIPRATAQIYAEAQRLEEKGWTYKMEGSFVEVYNENLNDLLGKAEELDKKKLEIRHDAAKKQTMISNVTTVPLDSPTRVEEILERAASNRSVAATMANQRSSRSHSVFILKLVGENSITGERSEGTLNLVDLAGSERLSHSGVTGDRLKETQNINRSLSCLGDVISALGSGKEGAHIPYRNSKVGEKKHDMVHHADGLYLAHVSPPILVGRKLQNTDVCHGIPVASTSQRDIDELEVRHQGMFLPHCMSRA